MLVSTNRRGPPRLEAFRDFVFEGGLVFLHVTWVQSHTASWSVSDREDIPVLRSPSTLRAACGLWQIRACPRCEHLCIL